MQEGGKEKGSERGRERGRGKGCRRQKGGQEGGIGEDSIPNHFQIVNLYIHLCIGNVAIFYGSKYREHFLFSCQ